MKLERYDISIDGEMYSDPDGIYVYFDDVIDEIERLTKELMNILAVIHRDGGHHTAAVGIEQSVNDAHQRWAELMTEIERLQTALDMQTAETNGCMEEIERLKLCANCVYFEHHGNGDGMCTEPSHHMEHTDVFNQCDDWECAQTIQEG